MNDIPDNTLPAERSRFSNIPVDLAGVRFQNYGDMRALAVDMSNAGAAIPPIFRGSPGACLGVIIDAVRFGMNPYALAREAYIVHANRESASLAYQAKAIHAIVLARAPLAKRPKITFAGTGKDLACTVRFELTDGDVVEHTSPPIGDITIQNSPLWKSDRQQQLAYYTVRAAGRLHFPDILMGLYSPEEREAMTIDITPKTSGVASRLKGTTDQPAPTHADNIAKEMGGKWPGLEPVPDDLKQALKDSLKEVPATPEPPEQNNAPTADAEVKEEPSTDGGQTDEEREWLYDLTEALVGVTNSMELDAVATEFRSNHGDLSEATQAEAQAKLDAKLRKLRAKK